MQDLQIALSRYAGVTVVVDDLSPSKLILPANSKRVALIFTSSTFANFGSTTIFLDQKATRAITTLWDSAPNNTQILDVFTYGRIIQSDIWSQGNNIGSSWWCTEILSDITPPQLTVADVRRLAPYRDEA